jgi:transposase
MFWILNTGAQWRDMPQRYGKWKTVYDRYRRWMRDGLFDRILHRLHLELDADGRIDWDVFDGDGSSIRAWLSRRAIEAVIPNRSNQPAAKNNGKKYRGRNAIERCIDWLKWCRRVATRYEKLAESYLAMVKLAMIQRCN